jgi:hypothetical protein
MPAWCTIIVVGCVLPDVKMPSVHWSSSPRGRHRAKCVRRPQSTGSDTRAPVAASGGGRGVNVTVNEHNALAGFQSQTSRVDSNGNVAVDVILKKAVDGSLIVLVWPETRPGVRVRMNKLLIVL